MREGEKMPRQRIFIIGIITLTLICFLTGWITVNKYEPACNGERQVRFNVEERSQIRADKKLAIIVPIHEGDQDLAIKSLQQWPMMCHPLTKHNVDLVIYKAENKSNNNNNILSRITGDSTRCFRTTFVVHGNLLPEENVYPIGASVQFYKLFLDPTVRRSIIMYDAFAIIEWDVLVVDGSSFERLYKSAFNSEPFWVKGSTLAGSEFHGAASMQEKWHILGHLNGNAIYNNTDPAFKEFVNFTLSRWGFTYSYDVALWATISDFPYSWPLWQRYSSNFVATNLIKNIGFHDISNDDVLSAVATDTLFIHGSTQSLGSVSHHMVRPSGCTSACGAREHVRGFLVSTFCDSKCSDHDPLVRSSFDQTGCGAGNPSKFGPGCRICYNEPHEVLKAHNARRQSNTSLFASDSNVLMCTTEKLPESTGCSQECRNDINTICDSRCGSGYYGDFHCNWRRMGEACRFCFHDLVAARAADKIAAKMRGRVVMCGTHEPPPPDVANETLRAMERQVFHPIPKDSSKKRERSLFAHPSNNLLQQEQLSTEDPRAVEFLPKVKMGQICAFIPGYAAFHRVVDISVMSIHRFMPGIRVVIATSPASFNVYDRTLGHEPWVSIVNSSHERFAALEADLTCGSETQLILYMAPGEVLSRPFTSKDTHSPTGELLVMYSEAEHSSLAYSLRSMASTSLLGFYPPSFTFRTDLMLPVETNNQLRQKLIAVSPQQITQAAKENGGKYDFEVFRKILQSFSTNTPGYASIHLPEVLAAVAFQNNQGGIRFVNLRHWNHHHLFKDISIWDVPLVKPRFGCKVFVSFKDHEGADELRQWVDAFSRGARCERGFIRHISNPSPRTTGVQDKTLS